MLLDCDSGPEIWHRPPNVTMGRMLSFPHNWISARRLQCRLWPSYWPPPVSQSTTDNAPAAPLISHHRHLVTWSQPPGSSIIDNVYKTIADTGAHPSRHSRLRDSDWLIMSPYWPLIGHHRGARQMMAPKYVSTLTIKSIIYHEN